MRTRQPLSRLLIRAPNDTAASALDDHKEQILEELNVKSIEFIARDAGLVSYRIKPNLPVLGKRYGKLIPVIRAALQDADGAAIDAKRKRFACCFQRLCRKRNGAKPSVRWAIHRKDQMSARRVDRSPASPYLPNVAAV